MAKKRVIVGYELEFSGDVHLTPKDLWPDGVPEKHTACDVRKMIRKDGGPSGILNNWDLAQELEVTVSPIYDTVDDDEDETPTE